MQKKGEMSRLTINLLIGFLILALAVIIFILIRSYTQGSKYETLSGDDIDLKISQVKQIDDNNLGLTLSRNIGQGSFSGLSFIVYDGVNIEIIKLDAFIEENNSEELSLYFNQVNASRIKSISVSTIYTNEEGLKVTGGVKDEYITPDTCSNYCPPNAQCGITGCGLFCGNGCAKGYFCLNYKCIKEKTSSGSGGGDSGGSNECKDTCSSLIYQCGTYTICGKSVNCGTCDEGYICDSSGLCIAEQCVTETDAQFCLRLGKDCGRVTGTDNCGNSKTVSNCGSCSSPLTCGGNGTANVCGCTPTTCSALGRNCGTVSNGCGGTLTCGNYGGGCQTGYSCAANGTCVRDCVPNCAGKQCGDNGCGGSCGICQSGYSCAANGTCVKDVVVTCNGVTCKSGEYCSNGVCLENVTGNTYFVATNGNDNNPGTFERPWKTWQKAFTSTSVNAGDIVYIRGGVYPTTVKTGLGIEPSRSGTENHWITYSNYPGETPILDCDNIVKSDILYPGLRNVGILFEDIYYVKVIGLNVRNVKQYYNRNFGVGIRVVGGIMVFERCTVYDIWGHGFETWFGDRAEDKVYFINCDAYNCCDWISGDPLGTNAGNTGAGFSLWDRDSKALGEVHLYNCRVWNTSDQGFQTGVSYYVKAVGCWSFWNQGYYYTGQVYGGGTGWKLGWMDYESQLREYYSNLAVCNDGTGILTNEYYGADIPFTGIYHNLVYKNGLANERGIGLEGFGISISRLESGRSDKELLRVLKNNIAYDNYMDDIKLIQNAIYTHECNSWDSTVTVTDNDFISLNCSQLIKPRKADGSLPDITFGHLAQGSDLIDAGVVIPGYHCTTAGAHPGENCKEWYGSAPDLGPFESNY